MEGTQSPTKRPRSRSPENQSQIDRANEIPAAAKNSNLDVAMGLRSANVREAEDEEEELLISRF